MKPKQVRITVLKKTFNTDFFEAYTWILAKTV